MSSLGVEPKRRSQEQGHTEWLEDFCHVTQVCERRKQVRSMSRKLQKDLDFVHIPMYTVLEVKLAYIHDKGFKSRVYQFSHVLGMEHKDFKDRVSQWW